MELDDGLFCRIQRSIGLQDFWFLRRSISVWYRDIFTPLDSLVLLCPVVHVCVVVTHTSGILLTSTVMWEGGSILMNLSFIFVACPMMPSLCSPHPLDAFARIDLRIFASPARGQSWSLCSIASSPLTITCLCESSVGYICTDREKQMPHGKAPIKHTFKHKCHQEMSRTWKKQKHKNMKNMFSKRLAWQGLCAKVLLHMYWEVAALCTRSCHDSLRCAVSPAGACGSDRLNHFYAEMQSEGLRLCKRLGHWIVVRAQSFSFSPTDRRFPYRTRGARLCVADIFLWARVNF